MLPRDLFIFLMFSGIALHGRAETRLRIINGTAASLGEFPFIVSLQTNDEHFCGGTLVDEDVVVTAAHCIRDVVASDITVVAGIVDLNSTTSSRYQKLGVSVAEAYPCFNWPHLGSDIAILALNGSFAFNKWVSSIVLTPNRQVPTGNGIIAGWGATLEGGTNSNRLIQANVTVLEPEVCSDNYGDEVDSTNFCAAPSNSTEDACQGDSGGPFICSNGYLCGVISGGAGCGNSDYPGVYTSVGYFETWIVQEKFVNESEADINCTETSIAGDAR